MACEHKVILSYLWSHMHVFTGTCPQTEAIVFFILSIYNILIYKKKLYITYNICAQGYRSRCSVLLKSSTGIFQTFRKRSVRGLRAVAIRSGFIRNPRWPNKRRQQFLRWVISWRWCRGRCFKKRGGCQGSWITQIFYVCIVLYSLFS